MDSTMESKGTYVEEEIYSLVTEDFSFKINIFSDVLLCHLDVYNWSPSVYKEMLEKYIEIRTALKQKLYCIVDEDNVKALKLIRMFDFIPFAKTTDNRLILEGVWES